MIMIMITIRIMIMIIGTWQSWRKTPSRELALCSRRSSQRKKEITVDGEKNRWTDGVISYGVISYGVNFKFWLMDWSDI